MGKRIVIIYPHLLRQGACESNHGEDTTVLQQMAQEKNPCILEDSSVYGKNGRNIKPNNHKRISRFHDIREFFVLLQCLGRSRRNSSAALKQAISNQMNWIILIVAGLCETGFTYCLGRAKNVTGTEWWLWMSGFLAFTILSMGLLAKATQTLPLGTAYPVWTGIGAVGTVVAGIFVFHEPATFWRLLFITTLIVSVVGLKIVS